MFHPLAKNKAANRELGPAISSRTLPSKHNCPPQSSPPTAPRKRQLLAVSAMIFGSLLSYFIITQYVLMTVEIKGVSMSPTLLNGQRYLLFRCPYLWRAPRVGEIVVIKDPADQGMSIKRVMAGPGDVIEIRGDGVFVNKVRLHEPYLTSFAARANGDSPVNPLRLGANEYFVLGDNRGRSADSRSYGPVRRQAILGLIARSSD
jgi:signal peptidase I